MNFELHTGGEIVSQPSETLDAREGVREPLYMDDRMDPITHPTSLTAENFQEVFGHALPEGLDPAIFEDGGTLELSP